MPSRTLPPQSTRLENLSVDPQGAAFAVEGRPVRLNAEGYASPVASMREFYQHALSDYYERSAELSRQAAANRPPVLRRMLSWIGRIFDRLTPGPRAEAGRLAPPPVLVPIPPGISPSAPRREKEGATPPNAAAQGPSASQNQKADAKLRGPTPPLLQVVFADQAGVHVIWHLPAGKGAANPKDRGSSDPKAGPPRLELTYGLDSTMAQRLQDCYGQLAQLGYKIAGLDAIRAVPAKSAGEKVPTKAAAAALPSKPEPAAVEKIAGASPPVTAPSPPPRHARSKPDASATPPAPTKAPPEPPNPSFLPGL
jgi:hypothetical protein